MCGETSPKNFSKRSKLSLSLDEQPKFFNLFLLYVQYTETEMQATLPQLKLI